MKELKNSKSFDNLGTLQHKKVARNAAWIAENYRGSRLNQLGQISLLL